MEDKKLNHSQSRLDGLDVAYILCDPSTASIIKSLVEVTTNQTRVINDLQERIQNLEQAIRGY